MIYGYYTYALRLMLCRDLVEFSSDGRYKDEVAFTIGTMAWGVACLFLRIKYIDDCVSCRPAFLGELRIPRVARGVSDQVRHVKTLCTPRA